MRSKIAAVVLVLISSALVFGLNTATAAAASIGDHSDAAATLPLGLTGSVGSIAVLLGLVGMIFGLVTRARGMKAAKRAAEARQSATRPSAQTGVRSTVTSTAGQQGVSGEARSAV
jgi:hypothetical protein